MSSLTICIIGKYPPIQGGVSRQMFWLARCFAEHGHHVHYVTNSEEVEPDYKIYLEDKEKDWLEPSFDNGGYVKLHVTSTEEKISSHYIPYSNPFVTKLSAIAFDVVTTYKCEFIYTSYLEPYGLAGALVSAWTGKPYSVQHAGSDVGRLAQIPNRRSAYLEVVRNADLVVCSNSMVMPFMSVGVSPEKMFLSFPPYWPKEIFSPTGDTLDIEHYLKPSAFNARRKSNVFDNQLPSIGVYGKPGQAKGTGELIAALGKLKLQGYSFNFIAVFGSHGLKLEKVQSQVRQAGIEDCTYFLPYIPHWSIPKFLRMCTAVCFLENRFSIPIHRPQIPREVAMCGRCLILSQEILAKQPNKSAFIDQENFLLVPDPQDIDFLASKLQWVIENPDAAKDIGLRGSELYPSTSESSIYSGILEKISEITEERKSTMSLKDFQHVVFKLYTNPSFRKLLSENVNLALEEYELTSQELLSLNELKLMRMQISEFAESLCRKKFNSFWKKFTLLVQSFPDLESQVYAQFKRDYNFENCSDVEQIEWFANWLMNVSVTLDSGMLTVFQDIVKFELMSKKLILESANEFDFSSLNHSNIRLVTKGNCVEAPKAISLDRFGHDIFALLNGAKVNDIIEPKTTYLVLVASETSPMPAVHEVSETLYHLIKVVIGSKKPVKTEQLIQEAAKVNNLVLDDSFRSACSLAILSLCEKEILRFTSSN